MAISNIFRKLKNPTGEFLMFSQFADDIAKQTTLGLSYRVSPSRFAAYDIEYSNAPTYIPESWQNYYENAVAVVRNAVKEDWIPSLANELLWQCMNQRFQNASLKYIGDIPFYGNRDENNLTYNEIYCLIPISAKLKKYNYTTQQQTAQEQLFQISYDNENPDYPVGWNADTYNNEGISGTCLSSYTLFGNIQIPDQLYKTDYTDGVEQEDKSFNFNTLLLFYDIYDASDADNPVALYRNIPLGVYITGIEDDSVVEVKKIVSNEDAFGQGTSYGVRILTRFSPASQSTTYLSEVSTDVDVASLATLVGGMKDLTKELRSSMGVTEDLSQSIKDHLAIFKNYRTNVPYIRLVAGVPTWFVNGRNTEFPAVVSSNESWREVYRRLGIIIYDDEETATWNEINPSSTQQVQIDNETREIND